MVTKNQSRAEAVNYMLFLRHMCTFDLRPKTFKEIYQLYGLSYKTMRTAVKPFKKRLRKPRGNYYSVKQLLIIFDELGLPMIGQQRSTSMKNK